MRKLLKGLLILAVVVVLAAGCGLGYLTLTEYQPAAVEELEVTQAAWHTEPRVGQMLKVVSFNIGYGGLDRDSDFFMDGGKQVQPDSKERVQENLAGILSALDAQKADVYLLQEVDVQSKRSYGIDEADYLRHGLSLNMAQAYNYRCNYVPYPWPPIGQVNSGLCTLTRLQVSSARRIGLPVPFRWPVRIANLKRCLLVERIPVAATDKELVLINLHLEAYDDGEGKRRQTEQLMQLMEQELQKGNYVLAGGDFNQTFAGAQMKQDEFGANVWEPGVLTQEDLGQGLSYVFEAGVPTCRSLDRPYDGQREDFTLYLIDGFILSDNIKLNHVETVDLNFQHSDHNPVMLQITLQ